MSNEVSTIHKFERAGLGAAPFRVTGYTEILYQACPGAPVQAGGSCDYCGTGIRYAAKIQSSDGKRFVVGMDCVAKTGDSGLTSQIKRSPEYKKHQRDLRIAKDARVKAELEAIFADEARLAAIDSEVVSEVERSLPWCGMAGRAKNLRRLKTAQVRS